MKIERTDDKKLIKLTEQLQQHTPSQRLEQTIEAGGIVIVAHHQPDPDSETRVLSIAELSPTKEENELYLNLIASHPQNPFAHTGFDVLAQARVTAMAEGYTKVRTQYNITDPRLANLFQGKLGFKAEEFLDGLVRATWEITSDRVEGKITGRLKQPDISKLTQQPPVIPIVNYDAKNNYAPKDHPQDDPPVIAIEAPCTEATTTQQSNLAKLFSTYLPRYKALDFVTDYQKGVETRTCRGFHILSQ